MNQKTIIIIDDDHDDLDFMKEALTLIDPSFLCISFIYPEEAVRLLTREFILKPDFIFIDINMPRLPGDQCLERLRKTRELDDSILAVYSTSMPKDISKILSKGANYTFRKPSTRASLIEILEAVIFKTGFHPEIQAAQ